MPVLPAIPAKTSTRETLSEDMISSFVTLFSDAPESSGTFNPSLENTVLDDPESAREPLLKAPLQRIAAGFENVQVDLNPHAFRFRARKPSEG